jgi:hypothetical protein
MYLFNFQLIFILLIKLSMKYELFLLVFNELQKQIKLFQKNLSLIKYKSII